MDEFDILSKLMSSSTGYLVLILLFTSIHFASEPLRWAIYEPKRDGAGFNLFFKIFSFTALGSYILPLKLGIPLRIYLLVKKAGINFKRSSIFMSLDGLIYYSLWLIAGTVGVISLYGADILDLIEIENRFIFIVLLATVIIGFILIKIFRRLDSRLELIRNAANVLSNLKPRSYMLIISIIVIDILSNIIRHAYIFEILNINIPIITTASIVSLGVMVGILSMMPMGLLGYDVMMVLMLEQYGVGINTALLVPVINRIVSIVIASILGAWGAYGLGFKPIAGLKEIRTKLTRD